ncbi:MAG: hypothetical protein ACREJM_13880 [Candidatus Saccharimonadales bacterium]
MKIIQLNIWQGKLGKPIIDYLNAEKPDFVCMQEVNDEVKVRSFRMSDELVSDHKALIMEFDV